MSGNTNVLSNKVQHAVSTVRVDSVAMQTALDVLASSSSFAVTTDKKSTCSENHPLVSRNHKSVRVAIEEDALQQALKLQEELSTIVKCVQGLQNDVIEMTTFAKTVRDSLKNPVILPRNTIAGDESGGQEGEVLEMKEEDLALSLKEAFERRDAAENQYKVISNFMDKFKLSESDAYLLEHAVLDYSAQGEGIDFLNALERVCEVKKDLSAEFNSNTDNNDNADVSLALLTDTSSAVRIMEALAQKQQKAYDRLYNFVHAIFDPQQHHKNSTGGNVPTSSKAVKEAYNPNNQEDEEAFSYWMEEALQMPFIQKSLQTLQAGVPHYYTHTLELIATSRRTLLTRKFLMALTSGVTNNHSASSNSAQQMSSPPLERMAHDPVVYVGEMLAFCYQSILLECDLLQGIHQSNETNDNEISVEDETILDSAGNIHDNNNMITSHMSILQGFNHIVSGITRPLKSRIAQVITSLSRNFNQLTTDYDDKNQLNDDDTSRILTKENNGVNFDDMEDFSLAQNRITQLYNICGLLLFYGSAMKKTTLKLSRGSTTDDIDDDDDEDRNPLVHCVNECLKEAAHSYSASIRIYAAHIITDKNTDVKDTSCKLIHSLLTKLCDVRIESPGFGPHEMDDGDGNKVSKIRNELSLRTTFQILFERTALDQDEINTENGIIHNLEDTSLLKLAIAGAKKAGMEKESCLLWERQITTIERQMADSMIETDTKEALDEFGLKKILGLIEKAVDDPPICKHDGLSQKHVDTALREFYASLYAPPLPMYETWKDPVLRKYARSKVAQNIIQAYVTIYDAITNSSIGGYSDISFVGHTPQQVKVLLSL